MVKAGLQAIYLSGWQVAADANLAGQTYPDQSLYPSSSAPALVGGSTTRCCRADQIAHAEGDDSTYWLAPIVADAEAGFGGPLNAFELMKAFIEAGAAGVHFEDQLSSREEVRAPRRQGAGAELAVRAHAGRRAPRGRRARRPDAADRAHRRALRDAAHERRRRARPRVHHRRAHAGGLLPGPRRDRRGDRARPRLRARTRTCCGSRPRRPTCDEAEHFAAAIHAEHPGKLLAYNCSPSFNWARHLSERQIASFQGDLAASATASSSSRWPASTRSTHSMFELARGYRERAMSAYVELQQASSPPRPTATPPRATSARSAPATSTSVLDTITGGTATTLALHGSTEEEQFEVAARLISPDRPRGARRAPRGRRASCPRGTRRGGGARPPSPSPAARSPAAPSAG